MMPVEQFLLMCAFIFALVGTPGPANLTLMASGASSGVRAALPFLAGTLIGFLVIFTMNAAGLLAVVKAAPLAWNALRIACMGYIVYLAIAILRARPRADGGAGEAPGFFRGLWLHPLNPKAYAMQVTGISQFVSPERYVADAAVLAAAFVLLGGLLNFGWLVGGSVIGKVSGGLHHLRAVSVSLAGLMVASTAASLFLAG